MSVLGRVPRIDDGVEVGAQANGHRPVQLRVTAVDGRRVARLRVSVPPAPVERADEQAEASAPSGG
jgi:CBS domain containing-hemolysin-like protein